MVSQLKFQLTYCYTSQSYLEHLALAGIQTGFEPALDASMFVPVIF